MNGYRLILVSDVGERDGMALELDTVGGEQIAEVFEDEETKQRTVRLEVDWPVPVEAVRWLLDRALTDL